MRRSGGATAPSHPGPCPGSTTPSPCRHGPGATDDATARLASLCGLGRARFAPHRRHTRSQAATTRTGEAALAAPPQPVRPGGAERCGVWVCRGTRAASGSRRCSSRTACQCRGRIERVPIIRVVRDEGNGSLDAEPTSSSRVAPAPCHEARQEQQQRRQPASAAGAVGSMSGGRRKATVRPRSCAAPAVVTRLPARRTAGRPRIACPPAVVPAQSIGKHSAIRRLLCIAFRRTRQNLASDSARGGSLARVGQWLLCRLTVGWVLR